MNSYTQSISMVVPASKRVDCDSFMAALGRGPNTFSVPLSPSRAPSATYYGAHTYDDDLLGILNGELPTGIRWTDFGLTATSAKQAKDAITYRNFLKGNNPSQNFGEVENVVGAFRYTNTT